MSFAFLAAILSLQDPALDAERDLRGWMTSQADCIATAQGRHASESDPDRFADAIMNDCRHEASGYLISLIGYFHSNGFEFIEGRDIAIRLADGRGAAIREQLRRRMTELNEALASGLPLD